MDTRVFSVYNLARGAFLSSKVTAADGVNEPLRILKVLVSGLGLDKESGLWISPLSSIPSVPRLFPFDLLYLDRNQRVVESAEIVPGAEFPPYRREVASALILASRTLVSTQTGRGDRLIIGVADEIQREIAAARAFDLEPVVARSRSTAGKPKASFDKNGKEARPTASAVLAEPISPATTRLSDSFVSVVEPANTCAVAIDPPVSESPTEQSVGVIELEQGTEVASSKTIEDERKAEAAASPIEGQSFSSTEQVSTDAKGVLPEEGSAPSISDEEIEKESRSRVVVTGQHGGFEDLFSNWVDTPSSAWMPRNPRPGGTPPSPTAPIASSPEKGSPEDESKASNTVQSTPAAEAKLTPSSNAALAPEPAIPADRSPERTVAPKITTTAAASSIPTTTAVPQARPTTTFTAGALGMWRVSMPTAATPVGTVPSPGQAPTASSVPEKWPAKAKETSDKENPSFSKSAESELRSANPSKIPSGAEPSKVTDAGVVAKSERKPLTEIATGPELEQKASERAERLAATTRSSVEKLQTPSPQSPAVKAGVAPENVATPAKKVRVEPRAPVTANGAASTSAPSTSAPSKAQSRPSTELNGKPKVATPPSLGARFKRWLNPVSPVNGDRRRAHRRYVPGMVAHYYTGGSPKPHEVADISMTGFYLLTEDRWMPETMIQMTLQKPCAKGERKQSITILSRVVRRGSDGIAAQFVMPEDLNPLSHDIQPSQATDRFSLARFL